MPTQPSSPRNFAQSRQVPRSCLHRSPLSCYRPCASPADRGVRPVESHRALLPEGLSLGLIPFHRHLEILNDPVFELVFCRRSLIKQWSRAGAETHTQRGCPRPLSASLHVAFSMPLGDRIPGYSKRVGGSAGRRAGTRGSVWHL